MTLVIHTTKEQVALLMEIFGKISYQDDELTLLVPEWLQVMFERSTD
jgi:hypothetical protein